MHTFARARVRSPDFNKDGVVDDLERQVYEKMMAADLDNDGYLTRTEVFHVINSPITEIKAAGMNGGIPIDSLNPDTDGAPPARSRALLF